MPKKPRSVIQKPEHSSRESDSQIERSPFTTKGTRIAAHLWTPEEMCALLPEAPSAAKRMDNALILKALGEKQHEDVKGLS